MTVPYGTGSHQDPKSNAPKSSITQSNQSGQTPSAASQNAPAGTPTRNGVIGGTGGGMRRISNGKVGKPSFR